MEKIYPYLDIVFLILVVIFLLFVFYRLIGKKVGLQKIHLETANIGTDTKSIIKGSNSKELPQKHVETYAEGSLNYKLEKVKQIDNTFSFKEFINYCKNTFKSIVVNFNDGNLDKIKNLLSNEMYTSFTKYIEKNNVNNTVIVNRFFLVDIVDVSFEEKLINIKVKFVTSQTINENTIEIREVWYFTKNLSLDKNLWYLSKVVNE